ncbi:hypothetical protein DFH28DRAFT_936755 [Melampsora americana]|nr:hypothetical protein DFH28DRAFT_936755 [Melampsora americana]
MAHNNRMPLSMRMNGIIKVGKKSERSTLQESILETYRSRVWVNRGNNNGIDLMIAIRRYDQPLKEHHYYRFDGPIISRQNAEVTVLFPEEDYSVDVGPYFLRPLSLANTLTVNSRGIIERMTQHSKTEILFQNTEITAMHRHWDPAYCRVQGDGDRLFAIEESLYSKSIRFSESAFVSNQIKEG